MNDITNNIINNNNNEINMLIKCPYCEEYIEIIKLSCRKFIHGYIKSNNTEYYNITQINPHSSLQKIIYYKTNNLLYSGCGYPFIIDENNNAVKCDYDHL